jgi:hypothetical protein
MSANDQQEKIRIHLKTKKFSRAVGEACTHATQGMCHLILRLSILFYFFLPSRSELCPSEEKEIRKMKEKHLNE